MAQALCTVLNKDIFLLSNDQMSWISKLSLSILQKPDDLIWIKRKFSFFENALVVNMISNFQGDTRESVPRNRSMEYEMQPVLAVSEQSGHIFVISFLRRRRLHGFPL